MAGCSSGSGPSGARGPSDSAGAPGASERPSLELASPKTSGSGGAARIETYVGTLGSDTIEGGCVYLETADGRRLEVIYPDGWRVRRSPLALIGPDGTEVAGPGDTITIRGAEAHDMVSICQMGPIVRAIEVLPG
jgi:hypothetical protein